MIDYLPKYATIEQACNWLQARTGQSWILVRLLEHGLRPYFWFDYTPGGPAVFSGQIEGFQTCMVYGGDLSRLESDGNEALVTVLPAKDGTLVKLNPGLRIPLTELKFTRGDLERLAEKINNTSHENSAEKPLKTSERVSLLTIIAALCKEAKLDYTKHSKTAGLIQSTAAGMGVSIGETTIENHLKKIPNALGTRMK